MPLNPLDSIDHSLHEVNQKIENISRLTNLINTPSDNIQVRNNLRIERQQCVTTLKDCDNEIRALPSTPQQEDLMQHLSKVSITIFNFMEHIS